MAFAGCVYLKLRSFGKCGTSKLVIFLLLALEQPKTYIGPHHESAPSSPQGIQLLVSHQRTSLCRLPSTKCQPLSVNLPTQAVLLRWLFTRKRGGKENRLPYGGGDDPWLEQRPCRNCHHLVTCKICWATKPAAGSPGGRPGPVLVCDTPQPPPPPPPPAGFER